MSLRPLRGRVDRRRQTAEAISEPNTGAVFEAAKKALLAAAEGGNLRAIELLARGALAALSTPPDGTSDPIAPHVAQAAIAAALVADWLGPVKTAAWVAGWPDPSPSAAVGAE